MRKMSDTIARLAALRLQTQATPTPAAGDRLSNLTGFGSNPGVLRARTFVPENLPKRAPLVVVLHGCTQNAAGYDHGSGWSTLAEREGFALLYPEQQRANNANLCFNWFQPGDVSRGNGEAQSIAQMVEAMLARHDLDPARVFVTGLSAGGAMTAAMLAAYPDLFAGGAVIAGLAYGVAASVPEAFDRMRGHGGPALGDLHKLVRGASAHGGPWPTLSVWQGDADRTVAASNADAILAQWLPLHGLKGLPTEVESVGTHKRRVWRDESGRELVDSYTIAGMGHGTPLKTANGLGSAGPFMLDAGISSTLLIARFWGIASGQTKIRKTAAVAAAESPAATSDARALSVEQATDAHPFRAEAPKPDAPKPAGVKKVIEDALRAAGLMR